MRLIKCLTEQVLVGSGNPTQLKHLTNMTPPLFELHLAGSATTRELLREQSARYQGFATRRKCVVGSMALYAFAILRFSPGRVHEEPREKCWAGSVNPRLPIYRASFAPLSQVPRAMQRKQLRTARWPHAGSSDSVTAIPVDLG